ncbi:MAG: hypothetical protein GY788_21190 [bacterium]|nr:hypothetical protein [bacterium]
MSRYIVLDKSAKMPNSCWGRYRRVAVLEVHDDAQLEYLAGTWNPNISHRSKRVVRVVATWERLNQGTTARCAYQRGLAEAEALANQLNAEAG